MHRIANQPNDHKTAIKCNLNWCLLVQQTLVMWNELILQWIQLAFMRYCWAYSIEWAFACRLHYFSMNSLEHYQLNIGKCFFSTTHSSWIKWNERNGNAANKSYQVKSRGKQWLGGFSYFNKITAFSPGTCRNTVIVSSKNRIVSARKKVESNWLELALKYLYFSSINEVISEICINKTYTPISKHRP